MLLWTLLLGNSHGHGNRGWKMSLPGAPRVHHRARWGRFISWWITPLSFEEIDDKDGVGDDDDDDHDHVDAILDFPEMRIHVVLGRIQSQKTIWKQAVGSVSRALRRARAGLRNPRRPMAGSGAPNGAEGAWPGERSWVKLRFFCWQIGGLRFLYDKWLILLSCFLFTADGQ